jgi:hypothetical protein
VKKGGKRTDKHKRTSPKNLLAKGPTSRHIMEALKEIGNTKQTTEEEDNIIALLKTENRQHLMLDIALAPVWIQKIMKKALLAENAE